MKSQHKNTLWVDKIIGFWYCIFDKNMDKLCYTEKGNEEDVMDFLLMYLFAFSIFFVVDLLWLGVFAKNFYNKYLGFIMAKKVVWPAAIIFYLLFIFGLVYFAIAPAVDEASFTVALQNGALLGLLCYATYDLTNLATLKDWPLKVTIIDLVWGTFIGTTTAVLAYGLFTLI